MNNRLYHLLSSTYCVLILLANLLSVKLLPIYEGFTIPIGLLISPVIFLLSATVTELYGANQARTMVFIALGLLLMSMGLIHVALILPSHDQGNQLAFEATFGISPLILFSSLSGFACSQIVEITLYSMIKQWTGFSLLWLRSSGAILISQALDTAIVNSLYLGWGLSMPFEEVSKVIIFSYFYKLAMSCLSTPLLYLMLRYIKNIEKTIAH